MIESFDQWNEVKKEISKEKVLFGFKQRDIFYIKMGKNLGYEQNGKGGKFVRPIIVLKKLNNKMFVGIPLSTQIKQGNFFYYFEFMKKSKHSEQLMQNNAILAQIRTFSTKRLLNKIGTMKQDDFIQMKDKLKKLLFEDVTPSKRRVVPKDNCEKIIAQSNEKSK